MFVSSISTKAQEIKQDADTTIYEVAEVTPMFSGGQKALFEFIGKNLVLPETTRNIFGGTFKTQFTIEKDGSITNIHIEKSPDENLNENVISMINKMPNWIPAKHMGAPVRFKYTLPIHIDLK